MQSSRASAERCRGGPRPRGFPRRRWGDVIARPDAIACRGELSGCVRALCLLAVAARGRGAGAEPVARQECAVSPIAPAIAPIPRSCANSARSGGRKGRCSGQERGRAVPGHECCCAHLHPALGQSPEFVQRAPVLLLLFTTRNFGGGVGGRGRFRGVSVPQCAGK